MNKVLTVNIKTEGKIEFLNLMGPVKNIKITQRAYKKLLDSGVDIEIVNVQLSRRAHLMRDVLDVNSNPNISTPHQSKIRKGSGDGASVNYKKQHQKQLTHINKEKEIQEDSELKENTVKTVEKLEEKQNVKTNDVLKTSDEVKITDTKSEEKNVTEDKKETKTNTTRRIQYPMSENKLRRMKKSKLIEYASQNGVDVSEEMTKQEIIEVLLDELDIV